MTHVAMAGLSNMQKYWLITGSIAPRPIALVTTRGANGLHNAAPFSSFTYMGEDPPLMVIGVDLYGEESHRPGEIKDTLKNIQDCGEFVVNMVDESLLEKMVLCGSDFPSHVSELDAAGLSLAPSQAMETQRIAETPIAWECRLYKILDFATSRSIVFGEIVAMYFRDDLIDAEAMRVRVDRFAPCGRLGGPNYSRTSDRIRLPVPTFTSKGTPRV
jgi:flavin reductase (DIM6/NTAB) family NADH-FMN oxidoreductase RutF